MNGSTKGDAGEMVGDLGRWPLGAGRRWGSPVVVVLTLCVWVLLVGAQPAGAHPELTGVGATAGQVRVTFSTPLEEAFLRLVVREGDGRVISGVAVRDARDPRAAVVALERPATAAAVVAWRVLGEDGHPATGAASVAGILTGGDRADEGRAGANGAPMLTARVLTLIGPLALGGMLVLVIGVLLPVLRVGGLRPPGGGQREAERVRSAVGEAVAAVAGAWRRAAAVGLVAWAVGLLMSPLALLWALRAGWGDLGELLSDTRFGVAWWWQVAGWALAAGALALGARRVDRWGFPQLGLLYAGALGAGVTLVAISFGGHAGSGKDHVVNTGIDAVHSLATAAWLGGLAGLVVCAGLLGRRLAEPERVWLMAGVVVRFSALALGAVAVLTVTGIYRALVELGAVGDLFSTDYGRALLVKLVLFVALLGFGAGNRFVLHPRLERAALGLAGDDRGGAHRLSVSIRAELAVGVALLVAVAVMIGFPPPG